MWTSNRTARIASMTFACGLGLAAAPAIAQQPATRSVSNDPAVLQRVTSEFRHSTGLTFRYPAEWTARDEGSRVMLTPSEPWFVQGTMIQVESQPWDGALPLNHPEMFEQLVPQYLAALPGFVQEGKTDSLDSVGMDGLSMRFVRTFEGGASQRVHVLAKTLNGRYIAVSALGDGPSVQNLDIQHFSVFQTAQGGEGPVPPTVQPAQPATDAQAPAARYPRTVEIPGTGQRVIMRTPADWGAQPQGSALVLLPAGAVQETITVASMAWMPGLLVENPQVAQQVAQMIATSMPGLVPVAVPEQLGGSGEGVLLRYTWDVPGVGPVVVRAMARSAERTLVLLVAAAGEQAMKQREPMLREMFKTVQVAETAGASAVSGQNAWAEQQRFAQEQAMRAALEEEARRNYAAMQVAAQQEALRRAAIQQQAQQPTMGPLDPNLVGVWSSSMVLGGSSGWNVDGGMTSVASQMVYVFNPDGTYQYGSAGAGGGAAGTQFSQGLRVTSAGRWYAAAGQDGNYFILIDQSGQQNPVRYTFHNGQLVLGKQGSRSFWTKMR